jgi:hypothetical protein
MINLPTGLTTRCADAQGRLAVTELDVLDVDTGADTIMHLASIKQVSAGHALPFSLRAIPRWRWVVSIVLFSIHAAWVLLSLMMH